MNLATDKWIPVLRLDGQRDEVSLISAFTEGERIADLAVPPPERIALMRLLLCVAHAALDGPRDYDDSLKCRDRLASAVKDYLGKKGVARCFDLLGDKQPFLQAGDLKPESEAKEDTALDKLDLALASGNNPTLFDNSGGSDRGFTLGRIAVMLLTFQSFAPGGLIGIALWNKKPTSTRPKKGQPRARDSVCVAGNPLQTFIRRANLLATIHANLINKEDFAAHAGRAGTWGQPTWEAMPSGPGEAKILTHSYLGRLVPFSRAIRISQGCSGAVVADGLSYPAFADGIFPEPTATVEANRDKTEHRLLRARLGHGLWRELAAVTTLRRAGGVGGPLALRNLQPGEPFDLWVGALITDPKNTAKIEDTVESVFRNIPSELTSETGQQRYTEGVGFAQRLAGQLWGALRAYRHATERAAFDAKSRVKAEAAVQKNKAERERLQKLCHRASVHYWTAAERLVPDLFKLVRQPPSFANGRYQIGPTDWGKHLFEAARAAYDLACPHETPRQMRAHVLGRALLLPPDTTSETEPEDNQ